MKKKNRHIRILLLMITSQLLLTLFVIQWLRSQYNNEKERMANELNRLYLDTQDEIADTVLFRNYVVPVISHNGTGMTQSMIAINDTLCNDSSLLSGAEVKKKNIFWKGTKGTLTVTLDNKEDFAAPYPDTIRIRQTGDDMLLRSVRLIVAHISDSGKTGNSDPIRFNLKLDSSMFIEHFGHKMSGAGLEFNIAWEKDIPGAGSGSRKNAIYINPLNPFSLPGAAVTKYTGYLFNRILPQVVFGVILVFITALAFSLSYRSIRDHMIMNSLRNEFISNITHELRTPVATISVALESLGKYNLRNDTAVTEQYLRLASIETSRLEELINRALDNSLLEDNNSPLNLIITDINPVIREVKDIMTTKLEKGGSIDLVLQSESQVVKCDPLLLKGAIINLVENSIRYCDKVPEVKIFTAKEDGTVVIKVDDNGPGIPPEYHKKIFEKFFRLPSGNIHNAKGYGLGLSFVSQVIRLHNGTVEVRNLSPGCSFILKIPSA